MYGSSREEKLPKSDGGGSTHPCFTPLLIGNGSEEEPSYWTGPCMSSWEDIGLIILRSMGGIQSTVVACSEEALAADQVEGLGQMDEGDVQWSSLFAAFLLQQYKLHIRWDKESFRSECHQDCPLKSATGNMVTDRDQQMEKWADHYQELYSRENIVVVIAVEDTKLLLVMEELDAPPSIDELRKAIDSLVCTRPQASWDSPEGHQGW